MKHAVEYRDVHLAEGLIHDIMAYRGRPVQIMEFCGGHTHAIMRYGLRDILKDKVTLLSGPGCPVCVTAEADIDYAIALAKRPEVVMASFGDMLRVPGSTSSLQQARAEGADVRIVYSALDALGIARENPSRTVVMLGIGFETTAPGIAASLVSAQAERLTNYTVLSLHKLTPPAMRAILDAGEVRLDAVLGPGHVTAITGAQAWQFLPHEYRIACAVSGFEPVDLVGAIQALVRAVALGEPSVLNTYRRGVTAEGNLHAQALLQQVFQPTAARWRGLGDIPSSGLALSQAFAEHDASLRYALEIAPATNDSAHRGCRCGEVLRGVITPRECPLFARACTPAQPIGPCMVSSEGTCAAYYQYGGIGNDEP